MTADQRSAAGRHVHVFGPRHGVSREIHNPHAELVLACHRMGQGSVKRELRLIGETSIRRNRSPIAIIEAVKA